MSRVLLVGGSLNQTTMMHKIGAALAASGAACRYSPFFWDGYVTVLKKAGLLERTILGGPMRRATLEYLRDARLPVDEGGRAGSYDLVLTCSDLILQKPLRRTPFVLVQEGMTDPEDRMTALVRTFGLPRWLASTSTTGLSRAYARFCVASEGYRDLFARRGAPADRLVVTGIPNFDDCESFRRNDFPHRGFVLVATSDTRETFKRDDRRGLVARAREVAAGRLLVFKLHPNEDHARSEAEIRAWAPEALVYRTGRVEEMIANCDVLITQFSTVVFVGLALGKECHSYFDLAELRRLMPLQNGGRSAAAIAEVCAGLLASAAAANGRAA